MKKSIYDLSRTELKTVFKEFRKTHYYKRYLMEYMSLNIIFILVASFTLCWFFYCDNNCSQIVDLLSGLGYILVVGIFLIIDVLFIFKKYDLLKSYYEEKKAKRN